jgi:hypothetical protein
MDEVCRSLRAFTTPDSCADSEITRLSDLDRVFPKRARSARSTGAGTPAIDPARGNWHHSARLNESTPAADFPERAHPAAGAHAASGPDGKVWLVGLAVVLAFLGWALCRNITIPWTEDDNWYGAFYSQAAHVNLEAGIAATGGVPVPLYFGKFPAPPDAFYVHHPTLLPLLVTGAFAVFGESERVARTVPVVCSLLSAVLLWLLVRSMVNARAATLTAAVFATLPMELHYGDMVDFEPCLLMCMLAVLVCLRRWCVTGRPRWAVLAAVCAMFTLWMDWPGYLFILSLAAWFLLRGRKGGGTSAIPHGRGLRFGLLLIGLSGLSGLIFLLQIRHVRPDAWGDLWHAATMRLSSSAATDGAAAGEAHFTFREWCAAIRNGLANDFLPLPWLFAALGIVALWRTRRTSPGLRWCAFAMMPMVSAGVLYVVILRNESFVHDFATFYLIGAVAIAAGLGLEALLARCEPLFQSAASRVLPVLAVAVLFAWLGFGAVRRSEEMRSPFSVLDAEKPEPRDFIPALGRFIGGNFPRGTTILCNFASNDSLDYYSQRDVLNRLMTPGDWKAFIGDAHTPLGGILWLGAEQAAEVAASLPPAEVREVTVEGYRFALWRAAAKR